MHGSCGLLVTSITATTTAPTVSTVPTVANRRARTTPTTLGKSTLLVASTTTTTSMSTVPTGALFRSPYTGWMQYSLANLLSPEGEIILTDGSISVFDSYGKSFSGQRS